jgi:bifunctional UDP-N-acetylglucosamine pyrophosphorylase/glucosamine-1-phosphate N-acetyltransferase
MEEIKINSNSNLFIEQFSSKFDYSRNETSIILAAGHGKRIKSQTSKMLHKIWEVPTVERVVNACEDALADSNVIVVVGIKAEDVVKTLDKRNYVSYALQEEQHGTGHALQIALEKINPLEYDGTVYVFPGDMGLINVETVKFFKEEFEKSKSDMMVLTGIYEGEIEANNYGRIVRVPDPLPDKNESNKKGAISIGHGKVVEILEYKDILNLEENKPYKFKYGKENYKYTRKELIENREFNSGVYAFKFKPLVELINKIESNNVQKEIYLTDLIGLFNQRGYIVEAVSPKEQYVLMGFNNKSVLKEMDVIARKLSYEKLKDVITIDDPDDFFIEEGVIEELIEKDNHGIILDIHIGKGVYIGKGVHLNCNLRIEKNVFLEGEISFGKNVVLKNNARISCFYGQKIVIGNGVEIFRGNEIKGNVEIGDYTKIESGVRLTGNDQFPCHIGSNVTIRGLSYIYGSKVDDSIIIEHSILKKKKISKPLSSKADIYCVRFYLPETEGKDAVKDI